MGAALIATVLMATATLAASSGAPKPCAGGYIALTFDDGPDPAITPRLLDQLRKYHLRATFFTVGENVQRHPDLVRREAAEGNSVQDHTWSHPDLRRMPVDQALAQIARGAQAVQDAGVARPTFYRPPYDSTTSDLTDAAWKTSMTEVGFTVDTFDWKDPGSAKIVARAATARAGGIVQMHDRGHPETVEAIKGIAATLAARHMCSGRLVRTAHRNPDAPTYQRFYAQAAAW